MESFLSFNDFWALSIHKLENRNSLSYHACCDIWTTRNCKSTRSSHKLETKWTELISTLDKATEDKKVALLGKMIEEGMQIPVVINKPCQHNPNASVASGRGRKPQKLSAHPQNLQTSPAPRDLIPPSQHPRTYELLGKTYIYQMFNP